MYVSETDDAIVHARVDETVGVGATLAPAVAKLAAWSDISLSVSDDLALVADEWRRFEAKADCTVFQTFAWHAAWQKHIGAAAGVTPAIVIGRRGMRILFLMPLAIEAGRLARRLVWHASDLCDYNGALLAREFSREVPPDRFVAVFDQIGRLLQRDPRFRFDAVVLDKMPETVGGQANPFLALGTTLNPSGAYFTRLGTDWQSFYGEKRSSATRRRDRTKRKRLGELGEVRFVTPADRAGIESAYAALVEQKTRAFARMGVANLFARPGVRDFFLDLATDPEMRGLVHLSRLEVGDVLAAANLGLIFHGRYYHVLASYNDGPVSRFGPGSAHLHDLMAYAIAQGFSEFDFTIGDEPYKREWADTEIRLYDHNSAATPRGLIVGLPARAVSRIKRFIKQTPLLWRAVCKARALIRGRGAGPQETET